MIIGIDTYPGEIDILRLLRNATIISCNPSHCIVQLVNKLNTSVVWNVIKDTIKLHCLDPNTGVSELKFLTLKGDPEFKILTGEGNQSKSILPELLQIIG